MEHVNQVSAKCYVLQTAKSTLTYGSYLSMPLPGVLLVAGLIELNITVSMGTINELIFYANIVRANTATFSDKTANTFLSWFIA